MLTNLQDSDALFIRMKDSVERVLEEAQHGAKVLAFGVHPYISGATHRIKYFEMMLAYLRELPGVVFWNGTQICDWYESSLGVK